MSSIAACTRAVRAGLDSDLHHGAVVPPIHLSSTYSFAGFGHKREYDYSRSGNPTRDLLAEALAELEHGAAAVITSTGMWRARHTTWAPWLRWTTPSSRRHCISRCCSGRTWSCTPPPSTSTGTAT